MKYYSYKQKCYCFALTSIVQCNKISSFYYHKYVFLSHNFFLFPRSYSLWFTDNCEPEKKEDVAKFSINVCNLALRQRWVLTFWPGSTDTKVTESCIPSSSSLCVTMKGMTMIGSLLFLRPCFKDIQVCPYYTL